MSRINLILLFEFRFQVGCTIFKKNVSLFKFYITLSFYKRIIFCPDYRIENETLSPQFSSNIQCLNNLKEDFMQSTIRHL